MRSSGDESQPCNLQMAVWPWPYHLRGVALGYIGICCGLSPPPTDLHHFPTSLLDGDLPECSASNLALVTQLRGKLRQYSRMSCPQIVVPVTKTEKQDILSLIETGVILDLPRLSVISHLSAYTEARKPWLRSRLGNHYSIKEPQG